MKPRGINQRRSSIKYGDIITADLLNDLLTGMRSSLTPGHASDSIAMTTGQFTRRNRKFPVIFGFLDEPLGPDVEYACMSVYYHQDTGWIDSGYNIRIRDHSGAWSGECGDFVVAIMESHHFQVVSVKCIEVSPHTNCTTTDATTATACGTLQNTLRVAFYNETGCAGHQTDVFNITYASGSWSGTRDFGFATLNLSLACDTGTWKLTWSWTGPDSGCSITGGSGIATPVDIEFDPLRVIYTITFGTSGCDGCTDNATQTFTIRITELDPDKDCAATGATLQHGTIVCRCATGIYSVDLQELVPDDTCDATTGTGTGTGDLNCIADAEYERCCSVINDTTGCYQGCRGYADAINYGTGTGTGTAATGTCISGMSAPNFSASGAITRVTAYDIDGFNLCVGTKVIVGLIGDKWWILRVASSWSKICYRTNVWCEADSEGYPYILTCITPTWVADNRLCPEECEFITSVGTGTP